MWIIVIAIAVLLSVLGASATQIDLSLSAVAPRGAQAATRRARSIGRFIDGNRRVSQRHSNLVHASGGAVFVGYEYERMNGSKSFHARMYDLTDVYERTSDRLETVQYYEASQEDWRVRNPVVVQDFDKSADSELLRRYDEYESEFQDGSESKGWDEADSLPKFSWTTAQKRRDGRRRRTALYMETVRTEAPHVDTLEDLNFQLTQVGLSGTDLPAIEDFQGPLPEVGQMARHHMELDLVAWDDRSVIIEDGDGGLEMVSWAEIECDLESVVRPRPRVNEKLVSAVVDFKLRHAQDIRYFEVDTSKWRVTEEKVGLLDAMSKRFREYAALSDKLTESFQTRISITRQIWWELDKRARLIDFMVSQLEG